MTTTQTPTRVAAGGCARIKVECLECGKKFATTKDIPECPRCHGVDIDVRD